MLVNTNLRCLMSHFVVFGLNPYSLLSPYSCNYDGWVTEMRIIIMSLFDVINFISTVLPPTTTTTTTEGPARICKNDDKDTFCQQWKSQGHCTNPYYKKWMRGSCYQACGHCTDKDITTTTTTTTTTARPCQNAILDRSCDRYKKYGYCKATYESYMKRNCFKTCGYCWFITMTNSYITCHCWFITTTNYANITRQHQRPKMMIQQHL